MLLVGMGGVSFEVAKNLILAGIGKIMLCDDKKTLQEDLGANFYLTAEDINKNVWIDFESGF